MKQDLKRFTDELKSAFVKSIQEGSFTSMVAETKALSNAEFGTFKVIVSTQDKDRQGDIVMQSGWDLSFFKLNPVVLWAHDYSQLPVGVCTDIKVVGTELVAEGNFAPHAFAQDVRKLYDNGYIKTTSVGFIPKQFDANNREIITEAELLEFSFVPVPANPYALSLDEIKTLGLDTASLKTKGLDVVIKTAGQRCQLDDGTPGILGGSPLTCIPSKSMMHADATEKMETAIQIHKSALDTSKQAHLDNISKCLKDFCDSMKGIDISKSEGGFNMEECEAYKSLAVNCGLENERHSKAIAMNCSSMHDAIGDYRKSVEKILAMFPDSPETGDDVGEEEQTPNEVRALKAIQEATKHIDNAHTALKDFAGSEGGKKTVIETTTTAKKVETKTGKDVMTLDEYLKSRALLTKLDVTIGKALKEFNLRDRAAGVR